MLAIKVYPASDYINTMNKAVMKQQTEGSSGPKERGNETFCGIALV